MPKRGTQVNSKIKSAIEQGELTLINPAPKVSIPLDSVMKQKTLLGAINLCITESGIEDKSIYLTLGIDAGHFSNLRKGIGHFPTNKLNDLCDLCGNEAPLQWWANTRGYGLVQIETETQRLLRIAHDELEEAEKENELLRKLLMGKAA